MPADIPSMNRASHPPIRFRLLERSCARRRIHATPTNATAATGAPMSATRLQRAGHAVTTPPCSDRSGAFSMSGSYGSSPRRVLIGAARRPHPSLRPADSSHLPAPSATAEEQLFPIGLDPRHTRARRHVDLLEHLARARIESPQVALVIFPGPVPQLAVHPGDAGDESLRLDRAKDRPRLGVELIDLPLAILPPP